MWATVYTSVIGTSHETASLHCQDDCEVVRFNVGDEPILIAAIADGAGSASHSGIGSREAVQFLVKTLREQPEALVGDVTAEQMRQWFEATLEHLKMIAARESLTPGDLACTLLLSIVRRTGAVFGQIGDGAWVLEVDGQLKAGTWPQTGEYANVTVFLSTERALDQLQFQKHPGTVSAVAGFTDGLQTLALDYSTQAPFARFFNAMVAPLRANGDETELCAPLQQLLRSELVTSRTDDDKTLVLAAWREPGVISPPDGSPE